MIIISNPCVAGSYCSIEYSSSLSPCLISETVDLSSNRALLSKPSCCRTESSRRPRIEEHLSSDLIVLNIDAGVLERLYRTQPIKLGARLPTQQRHGVIVNVILAGRYFFSSRSVVTLDSLSFSKPLALELLDILILVSLLYPTESLQLPCLEGLGTLWQGGI